MSVLVYRFGCGVPTSGWDHAQAEFERATQLWDELVRLDRAMEGQILQAAALDDPEIMALNEQISTLSARLSESPKDDDARTERHECYARRRECLRAWNKTHKTVLREYELRRRRSVKLARQQSAAWWPNQNRVIQAYEAARALCRKTGRRLRPHDAEREDGVLAYQIQRSPSTQVQRIPDADHPRGFRIVSSDLGCSPEELEDGSVAAIQIGRVSPRAYDPRTFRGERDRLHKTTVEMRVDAEGHTLRLPIWLHRALPERCRIKAAQITWSHRRGKLRYQLCLTVSMADVPLRSAAQSARAIARVQFHWAREGGLKILTVQEGDDAPSIWTLPPRWLARADLARRRHAQVEEAIEAGQAQFGAHPLYGGMIAQPRSLLMFEQLQTAWPRLPAGIREWYRQVRHEWKAAEGLRAHILGERRQRYAAIAREIVQRYAVLEVPEAQFAAIATAERGSAANSDRHLAALHTLRAQILHQAAKAGTLIFAPGEDASAARRAVESNGRSNRWLRLKNLARERSRARAQPAEYVGV